MTVPPGDPTNKGGAPTDADSEDLILFESSEMLEDSSTDATSRKKRGIPRRIETAPSLERPVLLEADSDVGSEDFRAPEPPMSRPEMARDLDFEDSRLWPIRAMSEIEDQERFVVEGELAVERLLRARPRWHVESLVGTRPRLRRLAPLLDDRTVCYEASHQELQDLTGFKFHRGILATARREWDRFDATERALLAGSNEVRILVAHGIADPANLGAVIRNSRAFGINVIYIDANAADPLSRKAIRASAGNIFSAAFRRYTDLATTCQTLRDHFRATCIATSLRPQAVRLPLRRAPKRWALIVGNEGDGLPESALGAADVELTIPLAKDVDSLNVGAATAVVLFALTSSPT